MRARFAIAACLVTLGLAGGWEGTTAAASPRSHARLGKVVGHAQLFKGHAGVVEVLNASGRLVAHHNVRWDDGSFRFVLKPGRYKLELENRPPSGGYCPAIGTHRARVRAGKTVRITLSQSCAVY